ncbi:MAG: hypothetical protein AAFX56_00840 [Pseudomonadota bacterium]
MTNPHRFPGTKCLGFFLVVVACLTSACSTMKPIAAKDNVLSAEQFSVGDRVVVTMSDGDRVEFTVSEVSPLGIGGDEQFIRYTEMRDAKSRKVSAAHTAGLVLAINVVLAAAAAMTGVPGTGM